MKDKIKAWRFRLSPSLAVSVVALFVALGGAAWAAIPDAGGVINGCYLKEQGRLELSTLTRITGTRAAPDGTRGMVKPVDRPR